MEAVESPRALTLEDMWAACDTSVAVAVSHATETHLHGDQALLAMNLQITIGVHVLQDSTSVCLIWDAQGQLFGPDIMDEVAAAAPVDEV